MYSTKLTEYQILNLTRVSECLLQVPSDSGLHGDRGVEWVEGRKEIVWVNIYGGGKKTEFNIFMHCITIAVYIYIILVGDWVPENY